MRGRRENFNCTILFAWLDSCIMTDPLHADHTFVEMSTSLLQNSVIGSNVCVDYNTVYHQDII